MLKRVVFYCPRRGLRFDRHFDLTPLAISGVWYRKHPPCRPSHLFSVAVSVFGFGVGLRLGRWALDTHPAKSSSAEGSDA